MSIVEFAKQEGFTESEIEKVKLFWEPAFNKSWIYVSDELVSDHMGYKDNKSQNMMARFYDRIMLPNLTVDLDYREVTKDHELVTAYFHLTLKLDGKSSITQGNRRKYYVISGEAFKTLLMLAGTDKGKETRKYYLKVEQLAIKMRDNEVKRLREEDEEKIKKLETEKAELTNGPPLTGYMKILLEAKLMFAKTEYVYIMTSRNYFKNQVYKIGRATNTAKRLSDLNSGRLADDALVIITEIRTSNSKDLENRVHRLLESIRMESQREFFCCPYKTLKEIVEYIESGQNDDVEFVTQKILHLSKSKTVDDDLPKEIKDKLNTKELIIRPPEFENTVVDMNLIARAIDEYAASKDIDYIYITDSRIKELSFTWDDIAPYINEAFNNPRAITRGKIKSAIKSLKVRGAKITLLNS